MSIKVLKFGGTSVQNIERIQHVAELVIAEVKLGNQPVVVVSAMSGVTDQLLDLAKLGFANTSNETKAEHDSIVSTGEQISAALLALVLQSKGYNSRSYLGWQIGLITEGDYANAKITGAEHIDTVTKDAKSGIIPIISGFQGINKDNRITTIGRGGSDTSAVAISAFLQAADCDIYTDVLGVYTADPRLVPSAKLLNNISYDTMHEMSLSGAKVLHADSVDFAKSHNINIRVLSSFEKGTGTLINNCQDSPLAVAYDLNLMLLNVGNIGFMELESLFNDIEYTPIELTNLILKTKDYDRLLHRIQTQTTLEIDKLKKDDNIASVSLIGKDLNITRDEHKDFFNILSQKGIKILYQLKTKYKFSLIVEKKHAKEVINIIHDCFQLGSQQN